MNMMAELAGVRAGHVLHEKMRIGGERAGGERTLDVHNPFTGAVVGTVPKASVEDVRRVQAITGAVHLDRALVEYASRLVGVTREPHEYLPANLARLVEYGASPRATIAFCRTARALAILRGRDHVVPDDIARLAHRVLRHRLILGFEAASVRVTPDVIVDAVLRVVPVP